MLPHAAATARASLAAVILVACGAETPSPTAGQPVFFPRHGGSYGAGQDAALDGVLAFRDGCLWVETADGIDLLPVWPNDTKVGVINSLPVVLLSDNTLVVETGEPRTFGGGEIDGERAARYLGGLPAACEPDRLWIVSRVNPGP